MQSLWPSDSDWLRSLVPQAASLFFALIHPDEPAGEAVHERFAGGGSRRRRRDEFLHATTPSELEAAFADIPQQPGNAMLVSTNSFFYVRREQIAALATRFGVPASFDDANYVRAGGLIGYGADSTDECFQAGLYVGRILKARSRRSAGHASTEIRAHDQYEDRQGACVTVPPTLLAIADEVIE